MKQSSILFFTFIIFLASISFSCKKDSEDTNNGKPRFSYKTGVDFISVDTTLDVFVSFLVGVVGQSNLVSGADLESLIITKTFEGETKVVFKEEDIGDDYYQWVRTQSSQMTAGEEIWVFTLTDALGYISELSLIITTEGVWGRDPKIYFVGAGQGNVTGDATKLTGQDIRVGITANAGHNSSVNLSIFEIQRIFNNDSISVFVETDINSVNYSSANTFTARQEVGQELWLFTIMDQDGYSDEISFIITTEIGEPYEPEFTADYVIANVGGIDVLFLEVTCISDDWELHKCTVYYPDGLGMEEYISSGQFISVNLPLTFANPFNYYSGTWEFVIEGIIKTGAYTGDSFISNVSLIVPE